MLAEHFAWHFYEILCPLYVYHSNVTLLMGANDVSLKTILRRTPENTAAITKVCSGPLLCFVGILLTFHALSYLMGFNVLECEFRWPLGLAYLLPTRCDLPRVDLPSSLLTAIVAAFTGAERVHDWPEDLRWPARLPRHHHPLTLPVRGGD